MCTGWDIASATGQTYAGDPSSLAGALRFVEAAVQQNPNGSPGLFGAPVPIEADPPLLDRLIAMTGRDPHWSATAAYPGDSPGGNLHQNDVTP